MKNINLVLMAAIVALTFSGGSALALSNGGSSCGKTTKVGRYDSSGQSGKVSSTQNFQKQDDPRVANAATGK